MILLDKNYYLINNSGTARNVEGILLVHPIFTDVIVSEPATALSLNN